MGPSLSEVFKNWALERVQFVPVPGTRLHRLTDPAQDGRRRARQAVDSLRALGLRVQADLALDPELTPDLEPQRTTPSQQEHRSRIVQAALARSPQSTAPRTGLPVIAPHPQPAAAIPSPGRAR